MRPNLLTSSIGSMLVLVQNKNDPADEDWGECLRQLNLLLSSRLYGQSVKVLVITEGGAPNVAQRERLQRALEKKPIPVAVVTDNVKARFTSSTVALLNRHQRSFANAELDQAFAYLGASDEEKRKAEDAVKKMRPLLG